VRKTLIAALSVALAFTAAACGSAENASSSKDDITIGLLAPLTGGVAATAEQQQRVVKIAVDKANKDGGIDGRQLVLKTYDTQLTPEVAAQQAQRAVTQDKVSALIGPFTTSEALAVGTLAERLKVVTMSGSASTEAVTKDKRFSFRTAPLSGDLADGLVKVAVALGVDSVVMLHDSGGSGLAFKPLIETAVAENNIDLTGSIQYPLSASDVSSEVTKAVRSKPGAVVIAGSNAADYGLIMKTMVEQGLDVPVLGFSPIVLQESIKIAAGAYDTLPAVYTVEGADTTKPQYKQLLDAYNAAYDKAANLPEQVLGAYDASQLIFEGLAKSGGKGGDALVDALESLPGREGTNGLAGSIQQFSADSHDALQGTYVVPYKIVGGVPTQDTSLDLK
jgi:branched-chain amino acid transport system substrate-binding protein